MAKNLVIVESPAKAKTITNFLGKDYTVLASMGHVRDLPTKELGFDPEDNFKPIYEVSPDKKKVISNLKKEIAKDTIIWLATDEDREGEAIAWHLVYALKIENHDIKRIAFHEITKNAILDALKNPGKINLQLVNAQQARRILDRAVGYKLSPLLWTKVQYGLSAGRVQSVAVRIVVDREREIRAFKPEEYWKIKANFIKPEISAELAKVNDKIIKISNAKEAQVIADSAKPNPFIVSDIQEKDSKRTPPPPFTTSTLQQEASRKLGFSVKQTMVVAQQLYEGNFKIPGYSGGLITYMRTDSFNLSTQATSQAKTVISQEFGAEYALASPRHYQTKSKGAQEAHEAIRPVDLSKNPSSIKNYLESSQFKLYDLIWKRTLATQMAEAQIANTTIKIEAGKNKELEFQAKGQRIIFPGFMKAYTEGSDDPEGDLEAKDKILPALTIGQKLNLKDLISEQLFTKPPARYTEASLVKKLESEGIGRPSTYAPTISTIQTREYVEKTEDKKLKPTSMGEVVNDFLVKHFTDIVDLGFTAKVEDKFDDIAEGKQDWVAMLNGFYQPFINQVNEKTTSVTKTEVTQTQELGIDPKSGKPVSVRIGRYGPYVQIGTKDDEEKPKFATIPKDKNMNDLTLAEALNLFTLPREIGKDEQGNIITANNGRFGPYIKIGAEFFSIKVDPLSITLEEAINLIKLSQEEKAKKTIKVFTDANIEILNGRFGPYIKHNKNNYKIPKNQDANQLTLEDCQEIIQATDKTSTKISAKTSKSTNKSKTEASAKTSSSKTTTKKATKPVSAKNTSNVKKTKDTKVSKTKSANTKTSTKTINKNGK